MIVFVKCFGRRLIKAITKELDVGKKKARMTSKFGAANGKN